MKEPTMSQPAFVPDLEPVGLGPAPTIGRIVHYRLTAQDVMSIGDQAKAHRAGLVMHAGGIVPAIIVAVRAPNEARPRVTVNLQLFLDSPIGTAYVQHREQGGQPGEWTWPVKA